MTRVIVLGAGGHGKVVIDVLLAAGTYEIVGLLDPRRELWGTELLGVPVLGDDGDLPQHCAAGVEAAVVAIGGSRDTRPRRRLYELVLRHGLRPADAVHPAAILSPSAAIGAGPTIMAGAVLGASARLGDNVLVNTGAIIEHDCVIGSHVHVASGACLAGGVHVGEGAHVGLGACVNGGVHIGAGAVVGSGAVVLRDVTPGAVVAGVPARPLGSSGP